MAEILKDENLKDEQLDGVAGGSYQESYDDMMRLRTRFGIKFDNRDRDRSVGILAELYRRAGTGFEAHNKDEHPNVYRDGNGKRVDHVTAINDLVQKIENGIVHIDDLR